MLKSTGEEQERRKRHALSV